MLIDGLPPGSALHRALLDGHYWTETEGLLWMLVQGIPRSEKLLMRQLSREQARGLKMPKFKTYPWDPDSDNTCYGHVEAGREAEALSYLQGLSVSPGGAA